MIMVHLKNLPKKQRTSNSKKNMKIFKSTKFRSSIISLSGKEFINEFQNICDKLQKDLKILSFCIILFNEETPEYRKILRDNDFKEALDKSSGNKLVVFTLNDKTRDGFHYRTREMLVVGQALGASLSYSYSEFIKNVFQRRIEVTYPSILFFQIYNKEIDDYMLITLKREDVWLAFRNIQLVFESISNVVNRILPENYGNRKEIFCLIKEELKMQKFKSVILQGPKKLSDFIGIIKNILFWF